MNHRTKIIAVHILIIAACCAVAALVPMLPEPKRHGAYMVISYSRETNYVTQVNGDMEDVKVRYLKHIQFTGTDPSPFADETNIITVVTNQLLFEIVTPRSKHQQPKLTLEEWRALQPPIPRP